jgi:hypothetical protein
MTSIPGTLKQVPLNNGFYINLADTRGTFYQNNGTDAAPLFSTNVYAFCTIRVAPINGTTSTILSTVLGTGGQAIFRDMGKTLTSAGRTFRRVQLMLSTQNVLFQGTDGVSGLDNAPTNYLTGYIELPGRGNPSGAPPFSSGALTGITPVARLG